MLIGVLIDVLIDVLNVIKLGVLSEIDVGVLAGVNVNMFVVSMAPFDFVIPDPLEEFLC